MDPNECVVRFTDMEWKSPADRVRQKARVFAGRQVRVVEFLRGMEHPEWCLKGHVGYMLEGTLALEFDGGTVELAPGDGMIIPAGDTYRHRPKPTSDRAVMVLVEVVES